MSTTANAALTSAVERANAWLKDLMSDMDTDNPHEAYSALRATLHALRDRLPPELAVHMAAQLPLVIKGTFYENWKIAKPGRPNHHLDDFVGDIAAETNLNEDRAQELARAVCAFLASRMSEGEIDIVTRSLPKQIRTFMTAATPH